MHRKLKQNILILMRWTFRKITLHVMFKILSIQKLRKTLFWEVKLLTHKFMQWKVKIRLLELFLRVEFIETKILMLVRITSSTKLKVCMLIKTLLSVIWKVFWMNLSEHILVQADQQDLEAVSFHSLNHLQKLMFNV